MGKKIYLYFDKWEKLNKNIFCFFYFQNQVDTQKLNFQKNVSNIFRNVYYIYKPELLYQF